MTVAVVGAGVFGAWTAFTLQASGAQVTLIDQYGPGNSRSSSGGESRIIRCGYGPDEIYTRMAFRSLTLWKDLSFFHRTGVLWLSTPDAPSFEQTKTSLKNCCVPFEQLSPADLAARFPQIHVDPNTHAIFEPESGVLMARQAVQALVREFVNRGGVYRYAKITEPQTLAADTIICACGPWLPKLFPDILGNRIFPTRQEVLFFGPPPADPRFTAPALSAWLDFNHPGAPYGIPDLEHRGFKLAFDLHGEPADPDNLNRHVRPETLAEARAYLALRFPDLANAPLTDSRVCQYENTSNGDFLIDRHPELSNVWLVGGGSGHGFKHAPAVAEYLTAQILQNPAPIAESRFLFASKQTRQNREVY